MKDPSSFGISKRKKSPSPLSNITQRQKPNAKNFVKLMTSINKSFTKKTAFSGKTAVSNDKTKSNEHFPSINSQVLSAINAKRKDLKFSSPNIAIKKPQFSGGMILHDVRGEKSRRKINSFVENSPRHDLETSGRQYYDGSGKIQKKNMESLLNIYCFSHARQKQGSKWVTLYYI
jgi:hypothetical protein